MIVLVTRCSSFSYQNRIPDKKFMVCFKEHVLEPDGLGRSFDANNCRSGKRSVEPTYVVYVMSEIYCLRLTRFCFTPSNGLLMRMKINSDVQCHYGFSCQRTNLLS